MRVNYYITMFFILDINAAMIYYSITARETTKELKTEYQN